jgi:hypothetical protein
MKNISEAMSICFMNKIKVYPVIAGKKHQIEYSKDDVVQTRYKKILGKKEVNDAMTKTYFFLAKQLIK